MRHSALTLVPDIVDCEESTLPTLADNTDPSLGTGATPSEIDGWCLVEKIGEGASSEVFWAVRDGVNAAIKVARRVFPANSLFDVAREAAWLRTYAPASAPKVLDVGALPDGRAWFAMTLAMGDTLEGWIRNARAFPVWERVHAMAQIAEHIGAQHENGWVHRDLKPANIILDDQGNVCILDWALATNTLANAARPVQLAGTPGFIPPEYLLGTGQPCAPTIDTYALGCTLLVLLTKQNLRVRDLSPHTVTAALAGLPLSPRARTSLATILRRALMPEPKHRWSNGKAMATALYGWLQTFSASIGTAVESAAA